MTARSLPLPRLLAGGEAAPAIPPPGIPYAHTSTVGMVKNLWSRPWLRESRRNRSSRCSLEPAKPPCWLTKPAGWRSGTRPLSICWDSGLTKWWDILATTSCAEKPSGGTRSVLWPVRSAASSSAAGASVISTCKPATEPAVRSGSTSLPCLCDPARKADSRLCTCFETSRSRYGSVGSQASCIGPWYRPRSRAGINHHPLPPNPLCTTTHRKSPTHFH